MADKPSSTSKGPSASTSPSSISTDFTARCGRCETEALSFSVPLPEQPPQTHARPYTVDDLPRRRTDGSIILDASKYPPHLRLREGSMVSIRRDRGVETQYPLNCERCGQTLAYWAEPGPRRQFLYIITQAVRLSWRTGALVARSTTTTTAALKTDSPGEAPDSTGPPATSLAAAGPPVSAGKKPVNLEQLRAARKDKLQSTAVVASSAAVATSVSEPSGEQPTTSGSAIEAVPPALPVAVPISLEPGETIGDQPVISGGVPAGSVKEDTDQDSAMETSSLSGLPLVCAEFVNSSKCTQGDTCPCFHPGSDCESFARSGVCSYRDKDKSKYMDRNVYVARLPLHYTRLDLRALFAPFGTIREVNLLQDEHGNSRRVGFVHFINPKAAAEAVRTMNRSMVRGGREEIEVRFAINSRQQGGGPAAGPSPNARCPLRHRAVFRNTPGKVSDTGELPVTVERPASSDASMTPVPEASPSVTPSAAKPPRQIRLRRERAGDVPAERGARGDDMGFSITITRSSSRSPHKTATNAKHERARSRSRSPVKSGGRPLASVAVAVPPAFEPTAASSSHASSHRIASDRDRKGAPEPAQRPIARAESSRDRDRSSDRGQQRRDGGVDRRDPRSRMPPDRDRIERSRPDAYARSQEPPPVTSRRSPARSRDGRRASPVREPPQRKPLSSKDIPAAVTGGGVTSASTSTAKEGRSSVPAAQPLRPSSSQPSERGPVTVEAAVNPSKAATVHPPPALSLAPPPAKKPKVQDQRSRQARHSARVAELLTPGLWHPVSAHTPVFSLFDSNRAGPVLSRMYGEVLQKAGVSPDVVTAVVTPRDVARAPQLSDDSSFLYERAWTALEASAPLVASL